ncbi:related to RFX1 |uniref:Related to RFX1 \|nr:related to RFX1 \
MADNRPDLYAHMTTGATSSQLRPEPLQSTQQSALGGAQMGSYLGPNVVTPRQSAFPRDQVDSSSQFGTTAAMDGFDHGTQSVMPTDTPRAAHFGASSGVSVGSQHTFAATSSTWPTTMQQQSDTMAYHRYAYPTQTGTSSWSTLAACPCRKTSSTTLRPPQTPAQTDHRPSTSKMGSSSAYVSASQPEYQPEEIDSMLNQISTLYKTANTKKMAEFYRDKWARMWLTCNYTLKPSIQIRYRPLQAASFGKVLRSQFPDVAQRRLGGRGKTRFHYCGFGTSNEREAIKVKSLLEDEKAGKLQLSAGLSAEYASEARAKARSEGHEGESSYRTHGSSEASPSKPTLLAYPDKFRPNYSSQDAARYPSTIARSVLCGSVSNSAGGAMPRRHTVSHSYSGLSDLSFLPGVHPSSETGDAGVMHSSDGVSAFGHGNASGISEPAQSASLVNSPASSLHGYQYIQDPRHVPSSMPFRRSCQDLPDWPALPDHTSSSSNPTSYATASSTGNPTSQETSRKAWREYESLCQALLYSIYLGPDPLLTKLDGMIGDDVAEERMPGFKSLARMLAEQMHDLVGMLFRSMQGDQGASVAKDGRESGAGDQIFEAIKTFREESMLDVAGICRWSAWLGGGRRRPVVASQPAAWSQLQLSAALHPPFRSSANFQLRRRDNSVSSTLSDSHPPGVVVIFTLGLFLGIRKRSLIHVEGMPNNSTLPSEKGKPPIENGFRCEWWWRDQPYVWKLGSGHASVDFGRALQGSPQMTQGGASFDSSNSGVNDGQLHIH